MVTKKVATKLPASNKIDPYMISSEKIPKSQAAVVTMIHVPIFKWQSQSETFFRIILDKETDSFLRDLNISNSCYPCCYLTGYELYPNPTGRDLVDLKYFILFDMLQIILGRKIGVSYQENNRKAFWNKSIVFVFWVLETHSGTLRT